jgi:protein-S-isoprenylcysteine O-methyltransferase Ste14
MAGDLPFRREPTLREPTTRLARDALRELSNLVRLEVALAREELRTEVTHARRAGVALGAAAGAVVASVTMFLVAIAVAFASPAVAALVIGGFGLLVSSILGYAGYRALPRHPGEQTRERLESDVHTLQEHIS